MSHLKLPPEPPRPRTLPETVLTIKTPDEILSTAISRSHYFFENRLFGRGMALGIIGPPGCGKSRLALQLIATAFTGAGFLGMETTWRNLRFLILQGENSTARVKHDVDTIKATMTTAQWQQFNRNVIIHTLDNPIDGDLSLRDHANIANIGEFIRAAQADVVIYDTLECFAESSLNTDAGMRKTVKTLIRLAKLGNPNAAVIIVHHSLIGPNAIKNAVGFGSAGYGKGSNSLAQGLRGQINLVPRDPEDKTKLAVVCGKLSDGPPFPTIGVYLDPESMLYKIDPNFDEQEWLRSINPSISSKVTISPQMVAELVRHVPLRRPELIKEIQQEYGCQKTAAYDAINRALSKTVRVNDSREIELIPGDADHTESSESCA